MRGRHLITTLATVLAAGALGACGGSSGQQASSPSPSSSAASAKSASSTSTTATTTATGSDSGAVSQSPVAILRAAISAAGSARTVHVVGTVVTHGSPITFDMHVVAGRGAAGQISAQGLSVEFLNLGRILYLNGGMHFWQAFTNATIAHKIDGRWVQVPSTVSLAKIAELANLRALFHTILARRATFVKGPTATIDGQQVVAIRSLTRGGTLYVATTGQPYPVEILGTRSRPAHVVFDHYNDPYSLNAPANPLTAASLGG